MWSQYLNYTKTDTHFFQFDVMAVPIERFATEIGHLQRTEVAR